MQPPFPLCARTLRSCGAETFEVISKLSTGTGGKVHVDTEKQEYPCHRLVGGFELQERGPTRHLDSEARSNTRTPAGYGGSGGSTYETASRSNSSSTRSLATRYFCNATGRKEIDADYGRCRRGIPIAYMKEDFAGSGEAVIRGISGTLLLREVGIEYAREPTTQKDNIRSLKTSLPAKNAVTVVSAIVLDSTFHRVHATYVCSADSRDRTRKNGTEHRSASGAASWSI
ncbi:unnamed protein product [Rangifer tarandus platyrhynchus]|uniref:Uncharacterized protein n=1 Tax=Rangifer tarandus platyrhynchus TaxID=3082113 RepID=A0ABN8XLS8_RANTA|nr:unnamed protein product [Rangifer tarandus platyrhynchus]